MKLNLASLHPKGASAFCLSLIERLPSLGSYERKKVGVAKMILVDAAINALREATTDEATDLTGFSKELSAMVKSARTAAAKVGNEDFDPGDNYGFSGAADTSGYIYRYIQSYMETVSFALSLDPESCVKAYSGAMKVYAIYSCDGDPKGAVNIALREAEEQVSSSIEESYGQIDDSLKNWTPPVPESKQHPARDESAGKATAAEKTPSETDWGIVFISCSSKDYAHAGELFEFLEQNDVPVFFSAQSLPSLGASDYRRAIDTALEPAHHMGVLTSSRENALSSLVEAEWGLFINELRSGYKNGNLVTMVVDGCAPRDLPPSLRNYEVISFSNSGFQQLLKYVRKPRHD